MPEFRQDPIVKRWIVMAPERANRPIEVHDEPLVSAQGFDPFAEGNENATTEEILAVRNPGSEPNGPGWRVRVVSNKYPALHLHAGIDEQQLGIYDRMDGFGAHEVIIECPHGETNLSRLSLENVREVLGVYRDRLRDLKQDRRLVHALIFKNKGPLAGASLPHSHSQLIAMPIVPIAISEELAGANEFFRQTGQSVFMAMIQQELTDARRVVLDTPNFMAFCPYASRFPFEIWILPKQSCSHFESISQPDIDELGHVFQTVLRKLDLALDDPPYNYLLHTAPFNQADLPHFCWHLEIFPRTTRVAGYEWGSGFYINSMLPEQAAGLLRETVTGSY